MHIYDIAALLRGRQGGWLSPNDCRIETGGPTVPGEDDISPPNTSSAAVTSPPDAGSKIAHLDQRRASNGGD